MRAARSWLAALALCASACTSPETVLATPVPDAPVAASQPDVARGLELMARFECARCHDGTALEEEPVERHCVHCHQSIREGTFEAPATHLRRWTRRLSSLNYAPSLAGLAGHLRPAWIAEFLLAPHDVRPGLPATMPRLAMTHDEAAAIAAALTAGAPAEPDVDAAPGDPSAGLALIESEGCLSCHSFTGASETSPTDDGTAARQLAPDLVHVRDRMSRVMLTRWLRAPDQVRPGTPMPTPPLTDEERERVADAILGAPLRPPSRGALPERLPVLGREVRFAEVAERVLSQTCWHCHADPDFAHGDGGAGNTGGFGYPGRGVDLLDYTGVSSGYVAQDGERRSLFALDDGVPHLVRVLMARHAEQAGEPVPGVTGMPLGLPALPLEDIQIVETWIVAGRPN